ncbi:hypothetical protein FEDK69T_05470 [Flavobacterium enshiense DK69]|nr:hypothetical protein FEDK69T_05470 [Flavobacterium enshiense DK69]
MGCVLFFVTQDDSRSDFSLKQMVYEERMLLYSGFSVALLRCLWTVEKRPVRVWFCLRNRGGA